MTQDLITPNPTHNAFAKSWVESANVSGCDFPIQNLPFAMFRRAGSSEAFRGGVAIGDQVIDMAQVARTACLDGLAHAAAQSCALPALNDFFAMGPPAWQALRHGLFGLLEKASYGLQVDALRGCLIPQSEVEFTLPTAIGDYTDFYTSLDHAMNIGVMMRPDDPITSNFKWMPIAYHGRVSSIGVSGQKYRRPMGQAMAPGATAPVYGPCARLDYELELGIYIGRGNAQGEPIALKDAEKHIFGICLLNDWSARDIQFWEMAPLGPFLGKNFCTTISPWIVTMEALAPYRQAWTRPASDPQPLAYLEDAGNREQGAIDISLEVWLESNKLRAEGKGPSRLSATSFKYQYWTVAQMVTHHSMGGCNLKSGDLFGSGTISGPGEGQAGAMIELAYGGSKPVPLGNGETRGFLHDGDAVILRGWCEKPGHARIGFGESKGTILPAIGTCKEIRPMPTMPLNFQQLPRSFAELVEPSRTALVMWDMQKGLAGKAPNLAALQTAASKLLDAAEKAGVLVAWSRHTFPAMEHLTGPWLAWMMRKQGVSRPEDLRPMFQAGSDEVEFLDGMAPRTHHLVFTKQQPSLFVDTPFDHCLKVRGIRTVVLAGFATDIGVELTARHGMALGYHAVVAEDACGAYVQASHDRSIAFLRDWANVATAANVVSEWLARPSPPPQA